MEFTEMEKRMLYQTEGTERYAVMQEMAMASQYAGDPARRKAAKSLMEKLRPLTDAIHFNDEKNTYSKNNDWKPDTYYVTKGYSILQTNFESREAALKWVQELANTLTDWGSQSCPPSNPCGKNMPGTWNRNGKPILLTSRPGLT